MSFNFNKISNSPSQPKHESDPGSLDDSWNDIDTPKPHLSICGVGGAGGNVINRMIEAEINEVNYFVLNTDAVDLKKSLSANRVIIGKKLTRGLGAGMQPEIGRESALEAKDEIADLLEGTDMLFIAAGMGGGTGTGAAPVVAQAAMEKGILTVAVVTTPFDFEGKKRMDIALKGIEELKKHVDTIMIIPNQKLFELDKNKNQKKLKLKEAFYLADNVLKDAISGLTVMINKSGDINLDFNDVRKVMHRKGKAIIGVGRAQGENRGEIAAKEAISSPLLKSELIKYSTGVIIHIVADDNLTLDQAQQACLVIEEASENADVIWGVTHDKDMDDSVEVTVIAAGFENFHEHQENKKTLSVKETFRVWEGQEDTKIIDLQKKEDAAPAGQGLHQSLANSAPATQPYEGPAAQGKIPDTYQLGKEDMREVEDKPHVPDHFKSAANTALSDNYEIPAYIRRQLKNE